MKLRSFLLLPFAIAVTTAPILSISFPDIQPAFSKSPKKEVKKKPPAPKPCTPPPINPDGTLPFEECLEDIPKNPPNDPPKDPPKDPSDELLPF
jgi:hypothetical protein